jgi:hypothetical protein
MWDDIDLYHAPWYLTTDPCRFPAPEEAVNRGVGVTF